MYSGRCQTHAQNRMHVRCFMPALSITLRVYDYGHEIADPLWHASQYVIWRWHTPVCTESVFASWILQPMPLPCRSFPMSGMPNCGMPRDFFQFFCGTYFWLHPVRLSCQSHLGFCHVIPGPAHCPAGVAGLLVPFP